MRTGTQQAHGCGPPGADHGAQGADTIALRATGRADGTAISGPKRPALKRPGGHCYDMSDTTGHPAMKRNPSEMSSTCLEALHEPDWAPEVNVPFVASPRRFG
jgi:hypothetical protein